MKDYEVYTTRDTSSKIDRILRRIWPSDFRIGGMRTEEGQVRRTNKTRKEIEEHYRRKGLKVLSITECTRTKNQKVPII